MAELELVEPTHAVNVPDVLRLFRPSNVFAILRLFRPADDETIGAALAHMGFTMVHFLDRIAGGASPDEPVDVPLVGQLAQSIAPRNSPSIQWLSLRHVAIDVYGDIALQPEMFQLVTDTRYEMRIFARMKTAPSASAVYDLLAEMGWKDIHLVLLKKNIHLPRRKGTDLSQWFVEATWAKGGTYTTDLDPVLIDKIHALSSPVFASETPATDHA